MNKKKQLLKIGTIATAFLLFIHLNSFIVNAKTYQNSENIVDGRLSLSQSDAGMIPHSSEVPSNSQKMNPDSTNHHAVDESEKTTSVNIEQEELHGSSDDKENDDTVSTEENTSSVEKRVYVGSTGTGTQADPFVLDVTDTTSTSTGYQVTTSATNSIFTITEPGAYYILQGGTASNPSKNSIIVGADNVTLTLNGINVSPNYRSNAPLNTQNYNVVLDVNSGTTNSFLNNNYFLSLLSAGILHTPLQGNGTIAGTLRIKGDGKLSVQGGIDSAAIGGAQAGVNGDIIIEGNVSVNASGYGGGIGSGTNAATGNITIGGNAIVKASVLYEGTAIGGSSGPSESLITIQDNANVETTGGPGGTKSSPGIGASGNSSIVIKDSAVVSATGEIGGAGIGGVGSPVKILIQDNATVSATSKANGASIGGSDGVSGGEIIIQNKANVTANSSNNGAGIGGGNNGTSGNITITDSAQVSSVASEGAAVGGGNQGDNESITINGTAVVDVTSNSSSAAIGGGNGGRGGSINIAGNSVVTAAGGRFGATIGAGAYADGDSIIIGGNAKVTVRNRTNVSVGAGIGGAGNGDSGTIIIKDSSIVDSVAGVSGAGIGGGHSGTVGAIKISTDKKVTASGGIGTGAGIGSGIYGEFTTIEITGSGTIEATGGNQGGAGIGHGYSTFLSTTVQGSSIRISDTVTVIAQGAEGAAGIGGSTDVNGGDITINGSADVTATGGAYGAGIGGGRGMDGGAIVIEDEANVTATGGNNGAGIGGGGSGLMGDVTINTTGIVTAVGGALSDSYYSGGSGIGSGGFPVSTTQVVSPLNVLEIRQGTVFATGAEMAPGFGISKNNGVTASNTGIISGGNIYSTGNYTDGEMHMKNGQTDDQDVFQNLLAVDAMVTSEKIESFSVDDAPWYTIENSRTFILQGQSGNQAYISVWLPKTEKKRKVFSQLDNSLYRAYYSSENSEFGKNLNEVLYKAVSVSIGTSENGTGYIKSVNGDALDEAQIPVFYPNDVIVVAAQPSNGYSLSNWSVTGATFSDNDYTKAINSFTVPNNNVVATPHFGANVYTITYELDGGNNTASNPENYTFGEGIEKFQDATKPGYTFVGWYTDLAYSNKIDNISATQVGDVTLYAKFTKNASSSSDNSASSSTNTNDHSGSDGVSNSQSSSSPKTGDVNNLPGLLTFSSAMVALLGTLVFLALKHKKQL